MKFKPIFLCGFRDHLHTVMQVDLQWGRDVETIQAMSLDKGLARIWWEFLANSLAVLLTCGRSDFIFRLRKKKEAMQHVSETVACPISLTHSFSKLFIKGGWSTGIMLSNLSLITNLLHLSPLMHLLFTNLTWRGTLQFLFCHTQDKKNQCHPHSR